MMFPHRHLTSILFNGPNPCQSSRISPFSITNGPSSIIKCTSQSLGEMFSSLTGYSIFFPHFLHFIVSWYSINKSPIFINAFKLFLNFRICLNKEISDNLENSNNIFLQGEHKSMSEKQTKSDKVLGGSI